MRSLAGGKDDFTSTRAAIHKLDVRDQPLLPTTRTPVAKSFAAEVTESVPPPPEPYDDEVRDACLIEIDDSAELPEEDADTLLATPDEQDLGETD
eukprot:2470088-Pyramimonas_sp.AAC.1